MKTRPKLTDEDWAAKFEAGEIEVDLANGFDRTDLAEVRAFELLRREYEDAILGSVRLTRHSGVAWREIGRALGVPEDEAISRYRGRIGDEAERMGAVDHPDDPADTALIRFMVKLRDDAVDRLRRAVDAARQVGQHGSDINNVVEQSDDDARIRWPFRS